MARIAIAGFQHETNTFSTEPATLADFEATDAWPGLVRGGALAPAVKGMNLPVAGFIDAAQNQGHEIIPLLWCAAPPSGPVTTEAFATILKMMDEMLDEAISQDGDIDGLYLDLHGAMVTETSLDGDGDILNHFRKKLGAVFPIVANLDLHTNISPAMVEAASAVVVYRTYPHLDMFETGERTANLLHAMLQDGRPRHMALRHAPFLVPLVAQCTDIEPAKGLYERLATLEGGDVECLSLAMGFPPADVPDVGPTVVAVGTGTEAVAAAAEQMLAELVACEGEFAVELYSPEAAIAAALENNVASGPVILADTQDNPGGGGTGDTVGLLKACIDAKDRFEPGEVLLGVFAEPVAAKMAHAAGIGETFSMAFGARHAAVGETPYEGTFKVLAISNGKFKASGDFFGGATIDLGPMALLEIEGVQLVVSTKKQQAADQAMFRHLGADPAACRLLGLKSSVHFRADFADMAAMVLVVEAPGLNGADPRKLGLSHLPPDVRAFPGA